MTSDAAEPLSDAAYAERYLYPHRAELDLRVRALLLRRGDWESRLGDDERLGEKWDYTGSFGGRTPNLGLESGAEVLGLGVEAGARPALLLHTAGVHRGCPAHASRDVRIPRDEEGLPAALDELEAHARAVDARAIAECLVFGPCGRQGRERDW
jgi:hypothetical protein